MKFSSEHVVSGELGLNSCGVQSLREREYHTVRRRVDWSLMYVAEGRAELRTAEGTEVVPVGALMLFAPGATQDFVWYGGENCVNKWIHFSGSLCSVLEGAPARVIRVSARQEFESDLDRLIRVWSVGGNPLLCDGYLRAILALTADSERETKSGSAALPNRLQQVVSWIHANLSLQPDFDACAAGCCLSRDRFNHVFREYTGFAPNAYRNRVRMERAKQLLCDEGFSVGETAETLGFSDVNYFCRLFRKSCGQSPTAYRDGHADRLQIESSR